MSAELIGRARAWRDEDPDPVTRREVEALLEAGDLAALEDRFAGRLRFGTSGLRGPVGAGPARMNRATVRRATAGLAAHLAAGARAGPVVVGRDARTGSADFLAEAVAVLGGAGRRVEVLPEPCPTPALAFAVLDRRAAAGVMITASHNPAQDNGYKVYLGDGMQIAPPQDERISAQIDAVGSLGEVALDPGARHDLDGAWLDRYVDAVAGLSVLPGARSVSFAYTPLHGVGGALALRCFRRAGFDTPAVVHEQLDPDPAFPTVELPNPEEAGAMDRVVSRADRAGVELALAHDPDADRLGAAVRVTGGWRRLTGDEIGVLLADHLLRHGRRAPTDTLATTVVSSRLLFAVAEAHGVRAVETLAGFKWVARAAPHDELLLGYEEALGYLVGGAVRDKDGISAAVLLAEAASAARDGGTSLPGRLDALAREHGLHATDRWSLRAEDRAGFDRLRGAIDRLRAAPPSRLGDAAVTDVEDLRAGGRLPPADVLVLTTDLGRIVLRPSGTEPKVKAAFEAVVPVRAGDVAAARRTAQERFARLVPAVRALLA